MLRSCLDLKIGEILEQKKEEIDQLSKKLEDLQGRYDKVEHFVAREAKLNMDLDEFKKALDNEKRERKQ